MVTRSNLKNDIKLINMLKFQLFSIGKRHINVESMLNQC